MAVAVAHWTNEPLSRVLSWSRDTLEYVYAAVQWVRHEEAIPAYLTAFITAKANGAKTEWQDFAPPPPVVPFLAVSEEALEDIRLALDIPGLGSFEKARLYRLLGPHGIEEVRRGR